MATTIQGTASWPGALLIVSCTYTCSHGISPGTAVLVILPQPVFPDIYGDLEITDGVTSVVLSNCKLDRMTFQQDGGGFVWVLEINDRRWAWSFGFISGVYNQLDPNGKLVPWMIRSPTELFELCLEAMDEGVFLLDAPPGLDSSVGDDQELLTVGNNFPATGLNPAIEWDHEIAARALAQLADLFGRRVVYDPLLDQPNIARPGVGGSLPDGSISRDAPGVRVASVPTAVMIVGAPTRYQMLLALVPVGKDYDGSWRPINLLSYAPIPSTSAATTFTINLRYAANMQPNLVGCVISLQVLCPNGITRVFASETFAPSDTALTILDRLSTALDTGAPPETFLTSTPTGAATSAAFDIIGANFEVDFSIITADITATTPPDIAILSVSLAQARVVAGVPSWDLSPPPSFPGIRATPQLTRHQARELAQQTVWRCYQVADYDVGDGDEEAADEGDDSLPDILVPGYGALVRKWQLNLLDTQCQQIVPQPLDFTKLTPGTQEPIVINFYSGYSHDVPAAVFGEVAILQAGFVRTTGWLTEGNADSINTDPNDQINVSLSIDQFWMVVTFGRPLYKLSYGRFVDPLLVLQTAVNVRDPDTNQFDRFEYVMPTGVGNGTDILPIHRDDVELNVIGEYDENDNIVDVSILETDPLSRAQYYAQAAMLQFQSPPYETRKYNGMVVTSMDGAVQQITWEFGGEEGFDTTMTLNGEHSIYSPPYPRRRRDEALPSMWDQSTVRRLNEPWNPSGGG